MEKMSVLKPAAKQPRLTSISAPLTRTDATPHLNPTMEGERGRRIGSAPMVTTPSPSSEEATQNSSAARVMTASQIMKHPKGHRVSQLQKIWSTMDNKDFLHLTDTLTLNDVWVQPIHVEESKGAYTSASFREIVAGPNIKQRIAIHKTSTEDLLKMLYLCSCLQYDMQNVERPSFEDWLNEMTAACVKEFGLTQGSNGGILCDYIINTYREFTFYPMMLANRFGIFFRKICYHSYKPRDGEECKKFKNMSMIKCGSSKGKFDYVIEAKIFSLPDGWFDYTPSVATETAPVVSTSDAATAAALSG